MDTLQSALGQFYFQTHASCPPTFLQVVGWTKGAERPEAKRHYVYVRKVPLKIIHSFGGGEWQFDEEVIKKYATEITKPIHKSTGSLVSGNAIVILGAHFLRYQSQTVPHRKFDFAPVMITFPQEQCSELAKIQ